MTISKEAIEHLEQTELLNQLNVQLNGVNAKSPLVAVPCAINIEDLESKMPNRSSYRMNFKTKSIDDFAVYAAEYDKEGAKCFIDSDDMSSRIIFDLGTEDLPEHQRHTAKLTIDKSAAFRQLLQMNGERLSQKAAANFIEDWADFIVVTTKGTDDEVGVSMTIAQASNAITRMTIESARSITSEIDDYSANMSATELVEVKGKAKMPGNIAFTCKPYNGLEDRQFNVLLSVLTGGSEPQISLRIVKLEKHEEDIVEEFKDILVEKFDKMKLKAFIGSC